MPRVARDDDIDPSAFADWLRGTRVVVVDGASVVTSRVDAFSTPRAADAPSPRAPPRAVAGAVDARASIDGARASPRRDAPTDARARGGVDATARASPRADAPSRTGRERVERATTPRAARARRARLRTRRAMGRRGSPRAPVALCEEGSRDDVVDDARGAATSAARRRRDARDDDDDRHRATATRDGADGDATVVDATRARARDAAMR